MKPYSDSKREHLTCAWGCCGFVAHMTKHKRLKHRARQKAKKQIRKEIENS